MLDDSLTPTRLVDPATRPALVMAEPERPNPFRNWQMLWGGIHLAFLLLILKVRPAHAAAVGLRLRHLIEQMGGLWFKVGQLLSLRLDILPVEVCRELGRLQNQGQGFPGEIARQVIEEELGASIESVFSEFVTQPFAAASIGQVHRAKLRAENRWVAVKVQRPHIAQLYARDLRFIRLAARMLRALGIYPHMRWHEFVRELDDMMLEELDYHFEASSMRRMRRRLKKHGVYVPKVYQRYTGDRMLVMEFIHAVLMADYVTMCEQDPALVAAWRQENNIDPVRIAKRLVHSLWRQLFEDNLYHGDLHPGNIVLLRDSRVAMIDFGSTNFTERELLEKFRLMVAALSRHDYAKAADLSFMMSSALPMIDTEAAKEKLIRLLGSWAARTHVPAVPYHERSVDQAAVMVLNVLVEYECTMDWAWLRIRRAVGTLDMSLVYLYPEINHVKVARQYFERAEERRMRNMLGPQFGLRMFQSVVNLMDMQEQLQEHLEFQSGIIRRQAQVFQAASSKLSYAVSVVIGWLSYIVLFHAVLVATAHVQRSYPRMLESWVGEQLQIALGAVTPHFDPQVMIALAFVEGYLFIKLRALKKWLRAKDVRPQS